MDKVKQSSKEITPFGGLNFIFKAIGQKGLDIFLNKQLGYRHYLAQYSYSDIVFSLLGNTLCNGSYISDIKHFKNNFKGQFFDKIPSADTVEYACQELKTQTTVHKTSEGIEHQENYCNKKNQSLLALAQQTGMLNKTDTYVLDYDNVVIENEKQDAKKSYKKVNGYHPVFAFIGRIPVHIENHNGNTPAKWGQKETLQRCFNNLKERQIKIGSFRADSASYQQEVVNIVEKECDHFYIRLVSSAAFMTQCGAIKEWETVWINYQKKEVATMEYRPFSGTKTYRTVVSRSPKDSNQIDLLSGTAYNYFGILTNDVVASNQEVIAFYNGRGDSENSNRFILSDFNLNHLPFMDIDTNTVYMYLMAMCNIIFEWIKTILVKNEVPNIKQNMRTKTICFRYVTVASTFITQARQKIIKIFSCQEYKILRI